MTLGASVRGLPPCPSTSASTGTFYFGVPCLRVRQGCIFILFLSRRNDCTWVLVESNQCQGGFLSTLAVCVWCCTVALASLHFNMVPLMFCVAHGYAGRPLHVSVYGDASGATLCLQLEDNYPFFRAFFLHVTWRGWRDVRLDTAAARELFKFPQVQ